MNNMPSVRVDDILIHPRDRDLIVATHGRSIWIMDDITPLEQMKPMATIPPAWCCSIRVRRFNGRTIPRRRSVANREFKGQNPPGGTAIRIWAKTDMPGAKIEILQNKGSQRHRTVVRFG